MTYSLLGTDTETGLPVYLPKTARTQGVYMIGLQGTGKSGLLENLIIQDIDQQIGVCVLDPHGELVDNIIARLPEKAEDKVILLDIENYRFPVGLNIFACADPTDPGEFQRTLDRVRHVFEKLMGVGTDTPLVLQYLRNCTHTLVVNPGYTMAEIPLLLQDDQCRHKLAAKVTDPNVLLFWRRYEEMKPSDRDVQAASILRRVEDFLQAFSRPIVGQSATTIEVQRIMDEGKILLVKLSPRYPYVTDLIGSLMVALLLNAAYNRSGQRRQFHVYADEFERYATEDFAELLEQARKFGIGTTIAHQNRSQLSAAQSRLETDVKDRSRSAGTLVVFRINSKDADELAGEFDITPQPAWEEEIEKEWHERVEEEVNDGEEEILTPVQDAWDYLWQQWPKVDTAVATLFNLLFDISERGNLDLTKSWDNTALIKLLNRAQRGIALANMFQTPAEQGELLKGLGRIFSLIYYDYRTNHASEEERRMYNDNALEAFYCLGYQDTTPAIKQQGDRFYWQMVRSAGNPTAFAQAVEQFDRFVQPFLPDYYISRAGEDQIEHVYKYEPYMRVEPGWGWIKPEYKGHPTIEYKHSWQPYERSVVEPLLPEFIKKQKTFFAQCCQSLSAVLMSLITNPLLAGTNKYQPRKHTSIHYLTHPRKTISHPQRTYQDKLKQVASELTNLPLYTARVKIGEPFPQNPSKKCLSCGLLNKYGALDCQQCGTPLPAPNEYSITTIKPKEGVYGRALQDRLVRILERNIEQGYVRRLADVEEEIRQRQGQCSQLPQLPRPEPPHPPEEEQPISRRVDRE